ncbi:MAG: glycosyltransferase family 4 protein [Dehalococcoidia bacterium]|jgi:1,2-diacylglycerol 3-alpha-glucosyltransferase
MKIALLTPTFSCFSGIDRVVDWQARKLIEGGATVDIFAFDSDMQPSTQATLHVLGMPKSLFRQRLYRLLLPLDLIKNGQTVSKLGQYDVVYSHQYPMNWLAYLAKRKFGLKYIYYDYGIAPPGAFGNCAEKAYISIFTMFANLTAREADGAISISGYLQERLKQDTGLTSEVVYPSIDAGRFHEGIDGSAIRQKYGLGSGPVVLYVGRVSPHKGIHLLLDAFRQVKSSLPGAHLLIVGKHTFDDYSRRLQAGQDDSVIFTGYVPDEEMPQYYAACDIYATATLWEGFDLPLAEAGACGKPAIAFAIGPHPEITIDGKTGFLVQPGDTDAMASALRKLLNDEGLSREMGGQAAKFIRENFT